MIWRFVFVFSLGLVVGAGGLYGIQRYVRDDWIGKERLFAYQRFLSYYAGRERCLSISEASHRDNEELLADVRLLGPDQVGRLAELHYLACSAAREDARKGNVPPDWSSRADHSWVQFDQSRQVLVSRMVEGLPSRYRTNFVGAGIDPKEASGVSASSRKR